MKMKTIKLILPFCIVFFASLAFSQKAISQDKKTETIKIKTSAVCGMCKDRIENGMAFEKGVKDVSLDVETKEATIRYNVKSTNPDELRITATIEVPAHKELNNRNNSCKAELQIPDGKVVPSEVANILKQNEFNPRF
jgi:hypothetical protein